jgi:hypothetical protein
MNKSRWLLRLLSFGTLALLASCAHIQKTRPAATPESATHDGAPADGTILKLAQIESVQAAISPTRPTEAHVVIHGLLHDGATRVHDVQQQRLADGIVLTVITARSRNAVASLALIPFERTITVNLQGMSKGPCKIVANGVSTMVTVP